MVRRLKRRTILFCVALECGSGVRFGRSYRFRFGAQTPLWLFMGDDFLRARQYSKGRPSVISSQSGALGTAAVQIGFLLKRGFGVVD